MAALTVQSLSAGAAIALSSAAGGGDTFANTGIERLMVTNGGGSPITVTIDSPGQCNFGVLANAAHDLAVTVAAGATKILPPLAVNQYGETASITYSGVTSVTVAAIRL
jgi:hypothetical protein